MPRCALAPVAIRCVYTDLDGTLLGRGASLFRTAEGDFTLLAARALEACHRAGAEVVIKSGRRRAQVMEDARLLGQTSYIFEVGTGLVIDGELTWLTGDLQPTEDRTIHAQIEAGGAPALLLERFAGRLEPHAPWHTEREVSHLFRGSIDALEADALLRENGHEALRLVDNGVMHPPVAGHEDWHAYHLLPRAASKAAGVAFHQRVRGYAPESCIAIGDSREDLGMAETVGTFWLVGNGLTEDPSLRDAFTPNVRVAEGRNSAGVYEAVVTELAER
jgi:phosphoglycolate phosphatase